MASMCLSTSSSSKSLMIPKSMLVSASASRPPTPSFRCVFGFRSISSRVGLIYSRSTNRTHVVCMSDFDKTVRRSPAEAPMEWMTPKPGKRPNLFPKTRGIEFQSPRRIGPRDRMVGDEKFEVEIDTVMG